MPFASALVGKGGAFVSEVDESDGSIALYRPDVAVLNNVTLDHKSLDELRHLFRDFAAKAETVVVNLDDDETRFLAAVLPPERLRSYSLADEAADLFGADLAEAPFAVSFTANGVPVRLQVPGRHNVQNALAALAACEALGVPLAAAAEALAGFAGLGRRFELVGDRRRGRGDRRFRPQSRQDRRDVAHPPRLPRPAAAVLPAARLRPACGR